MSGYVYYIQVHPWSTRGRWHTIHKVDTKGKAAAIAHAMAIDRVRMSRHVARTWLRNKSVRDQYMAEHDLEAGWLDGPNNDYFRSTDLSKEAKDLDRAWEETKLEAERNPKGTPDTLLVRQIPDYVKGQLRVMAKKRKISMNQLVVEFIEEGLICHGYLSDEDRDRWAKKYRQAGRPAQRGVEAPNEVTDILEN